MSWRANGAGLLCAATISSSSALLFLLQPMSAKAILPWFGGSAGVWTTCAMFFQLLLLLGYLYAWAVSRHLSARAQSALHVAMLIASACVLAANPAAGWNPSRTGHPAVAILMWLGASIGLPYFMLSTTGPLVQAWYAGGSEARFPYRLFALSNLASLVSLLGYPLAVEPRLPLSRQLSGLSAAYFGFVVLASASALLGASRTAPPKREAFGPPATHPLLWAALAACASALSLAVTNHLTQEVAAVPFLWVLPLSLYLLSFVLCFDREGWYRPRLFRWILPAAWIAAGYRLAFQGSMGDFRWEIALFSAALFACCMFCHGELARRKPQPREGLPLFYLMVAAGGALGAVFVALAAPFFFNTYVELPAGIAASAILAAGLLYGYSSPKHLLRLGAAAVVALAAASFLGSPGNSLLRTRNFYGTVQVIDTGEGATAVRALFNGAILHGMQFLSTPRSRLPTAYYGPPSGAGLVLSSPHPARRRVAVIGLGVGTLAAYGRPGDDYRFFEINPAVIQIASARFGFLRQSAARTEVVAGDGRLALEREPAGGYDVLVLDAFSGDSIPVHLLTRQAFEMYFGRLRSGGIVAVHVTNKYLNLASVVLAWAGEARKEALMVHSFADRQQGIYEAEWVLVSDQARALDPFRRFASGAPPNSRVRGWTDDYSNLFRIMK